MRPSLLHPRADPRERLRRRARRGSEATPAAATPASTPLRADPDVQRVREAGGPMDQACYTCECGYLFHAPVSTTVHCPHCGVGQAW